MKTSKRPVEPLHEIAWKAWEEDQKHNPNAMNPHAYIYGFIQGYKIREAEYEDSNRDKRKSTRA